MAEAIDGRGQQWLLQTLQASLESESANRTTAEEALAGASKQSGYGIALANIATDKDNFVGVRQLAGVVLKQYIKQHWQEGEAAFVPPLVPPNDKETIRKILLVGLDDAEAKIRTAVGVAIATIAAFDWPEEWPSLMPQLMAALGNHNNVNAVSGAVRCLALFADDIDDSQLPTLVPLLFPALFTIATNSQIYSPQIRRRALYVLHSCIATLGVMSGKYQSQVRKLVEPLLPAWMQHFAAVLGQPVPAENPDDWGLRLEVYRCLMQIVQNFGKSVEPLVPMVLGPLWQSYVSGIPVYERAAVWGQDDAFTGLADEDGADQSLTTLAVQEFEFLLALVGNPRLKAHVEGSTEALVYFAIAYMQMTEEQEQTWASDVNQFVSDEDNEVLTTRVSACMLLEELVEQFGEKALLGAAVAVQRRLHEAAQQRAAQQPHWWKLREASILAVGSLAEEFTQAEAKDVREVFNPVSFAEAILADDAGPGTLEFPFLQGRALWAASKFASSLKPEGAASFLTVAVQGLESSRAGAVKVGACRALAQLCPLVDLVLLRPALPAVYQGIGNLLGEADDEVLHLALEALESAIKADAQATAQMEASVTPAVLKIWAENVTDPVVSVDAIDVLEAISDAPGCLEPLLHHAIPSLASILAKPQEQPLGLVAGALDLLTMLLKRCPVDLVKPVHEAIFEHLVALTLSSDDHSELQNSAECLTALVRSGGPALLEWGKDPSRTMNMLLEAAARLLSPELEGSASLFAGNYVAQLILRLPGQMAPHLRSLIGALVARMEGQTPTLKASLILIFARLVHLSAPDVGQLLDVLASLPAEGHENALHFVLSDWAEFHGDILGSYHKKVSTTALALLLASGDRRLASIAVKGRPIANQSRGIVTRSKARNAPDEWTRVPFPAKVVSLLADVLLELQEQTAASGGADENEWEEYDEDEEEEEKAAATGASAVAAASAINNPSAAELIKQLLAAELEGGDDDYEDDPDAAVDPLNQVNMGSYIADYLQQFARRHQADFSAFCHDLTANERRIVEGAVQSGSS